MEDNPHLINQFCEVELSLNPLPNMVSEPILERFRVKNWWRKSSTSQLQYLIFFVVVVDSQSMQDPRIDH